MNKAFRDRLKDGNMLTGTFVTLGLPEIGEILSAAGFDWLCIDAEHAPLSTLHVQRIIQGIGNRCASLVRTATASEVAIKQALDTGATGIIVPMVNSAQTARDVAYWARYSPEGGRGVGLTRAHGYGRNFAEYMERANRETVVVVQAEHQLAVQCIDEIISVPGIDAVFVGPYDLSASLGHPGELEHPKVKDAIDRVTRACRSANKPIGVFGMNAAAVAPYMKQGYTLIASGVDVMLLGETATSMRNEILGNISHTSSPQ